MSKERDCYGRTQEEVISLLEEEARDDAISIDEILQHGGWFGLEEEEILSFTKKAVVRLLTSGAKPVCVIRQDGHYAWQLVKEFDLPVKDATEKIFQQWEAVGSPQYDFFIWFYNGADIRE